MPKKVENFRYSAGSVITIMTGIANTWRLSFVNGNALVLFHKPDTDAESVFLLDANDIAEFANRKRRELGLIRKSCHVSLDGRVYDVGFDESGQLPCHKCAFGPTTPRNSIECVRSHCCQTSPLGYYIEVD